jgi:hypothetical protein
LIWASVDDEKATMKSPSEDPVRSNPELDYAPPWVRERMRPASGSPALPAEQQQSDAVLSDTRLPIDIRAWHQRALDPELVPEPPPGVVNIWPTMLRLGIVCALAAFVAAAAVVLFNPKPSAHKFAQAGGSPPPATSENRTQPSVDPTRLMQALADARPPPASTPPAQAPPQSSPPPTSQGQIAAASPPAIASIPAPNPSPANIDPGPPLSNQAAQSADPTSAVRNAPPNVQAASIAEPQPSGAVKQASRQPTLDDSEINALIKRGNDLLKEGDFSAARLVFERAANAGSAEAALALGSTYDPLVIKRLGGISVKPDVEIARKWYQIAADRGSAAATPQLANLPPGR